MADRSSERDRRVRKLMGNRNPGFDVIGQAQAEIQDAQSELYNHIALQNSQEQSRLRETSTISQAAAGMMAMEGGNQLRAQVATMNPSTQATLGKFGVKPKQTQNSSRNIQTQRVVSGSGGVTNIRNENITNNRTDIRVTQPSIPMQQSSPVVVNGGKREDSTAKFKAWLSGMFARQQNEAEIQKKEYRKKEWALGRTTSKLMKKIGEATSNLGNKLDPKNMTSSLGGQLKWLLMIFGATMIGKVWKPAMNFLANLEGGFRAVFGLPMNEDLRNSSSKSLSIIDQIKEAIGVDPKNENKSLIQGIGSVFMQGIDKLIDKLKFWFEDRAMAMRDVEFPSVGNVDFGPLGSVLGSAMEGVVNSLKGVGQYLGDLMTVAFGGSKGKVKVEALKVQRQAKQVFTNTEGKQTSRGDSALLTGNGRNYMRESDYNTFGDLKGNASSTQAMSQSLLSMFNDRSGVGHSAEIATGVTQLFNVADRQGQVVIDPELLKKLGIGPQDLTSLKSSGRLTQKPYRIIAVKPNEAQKAEMATYNGHTNAVGAGITGTVLGIGASVGLGFINPLLGVVASSVLVPGGGLVGAGIGDNVDRWYRDKTAKGLYTKIVPAESSEVSEDGSRGIDKMLWVLDKRGADMIKAKITSTWNNKDMDLSNKEFYSFIQRQEQAMARRNGVTIKGQNISTSNLEREQAQYKNYLDRWNWNFESNDPESPNEQNYGNYNAFARTVSGLVDSGRSAVSNGLNWAGGQLKGMAINGVGQNQRAAWLMKRAMELGFTKEQAAGIAGNAMKESHMITETAYNANDGGQPGGGLAGWRGENCKQILRYARDIFGDPVNPNIISDIKKVPFEHQAELLLRTLTGELSYGGDFGKRAGDAIKKAKTVAEATLAMERKYEISGDYKKDNLLTERTNFANSFYQLNLTTTDTSSPASGIPIITSNDGMMVGKSGSTSPQVKNWLWEGQAPSIYKAEDEARARSLMVGISVPIHNTRGIEGIMSLTVNRKLAENVIQIFNEIFIGVPNFKINPNTTAAFNYRSVNPGKNKTSNKLSVHGLGGAIDINWDKNQLNDTNNQDTEMHLGTPNHPVVQIFYKYGWIWGGAWNNRDKMHFEFNGNVGGGMINDALETVGDALISAGDAINPEKPSSTTTASSGINSAQLKKINRYESLSNQILESRLESGGAKFDSFGAYIDVGDGVHAYFKDNTNALNGALSGDDISFVGKVGEDGRLTEVSEEEEERAKNSIHMKMSSMFSSYEKKGTIEDRMNVGNKTKMFYLGKFDDIQTFSKFAQNRLQHGSIEYEVAITRDGLRCAEISIMRKFRSSLDIDRDSKKLTDKEKEEMIYVGPYIFQLGRVWRNPFNEKQQYLYDWQPSAIKDKVTLTREADKRLEKLLEYVSFGEIVSKNGNLYMNGQVLSDDTIKELEEFRIINGHGAPAIRAYNNFIKQAKMDGYTSGRFETDKYLKDVYGIEYKDLGNYIKKNKDSGEFIFRDGKIYGIGGVEFGTYTETENGVKKLNIYGRLEFDDVQRKLGNEGLKQNDVENRMFLRRRHLAETGTTDYNAIGDFIHKTTSLDLQGEDQSLVSKIQNRLVQENGGVNKTSIKGHVQIAGRNLDYFIFLNPEGEITNYKIRKEDISKLVKDITGNDISDTIASNIKDLQGKNLNELFNIVLGNIADRKIELKQTYLDPTKKDNEKYFNEVKQHQIKLLTENEDTNAFEGMGGLGETSARTRPTEDLLSSYLLKKMKLIDHIETPGSAGPAEEKFSAIVYYRNGEREVLNKFNKFGKFYFPKGWIKKSFWDRINEKIEKIKNIGSLEKGIAHWDDEDNEYRKSTEEQLRLAEEGKLDFTANDGMIFNSNGNVIGTYDGKTPPTPGKKFKGKKLTEEDLGKGNGELGKIVINNQARDVFDNNDAAKVLYYRKKFGAKLIGNDLWVYSKNGQFRTKIDLSRKISGNMSDVLMRDTTQGHALNGGWKSLSGIGYVNYDKENGKFLDTGWLGSNYNEGEIRDIGFKEVVDALGEVKESVDLGTAFSDTIAGNSNIQTDQGTLASKRALEQITTSKNQLKANERSALYLEHLAKNGLEVNPKSIAELEKASAKIEARHNMEALKQKVDLVGIKGLTTSTKMYMASVDSINGGKGYLVENGQLYSVIDDGKGNMIRTKVTNAKSASITEDGNIVWTTNDNRVNTINIQEVIPVSPKVNSDGTQEK